MPPSGRRGGKTRVRRAPAATEVHNTNEPSDAEVPDVLATPSRASRKRVRGNSDTAAAAAAAPSAGRNTRRKIKDTRGATEREDTEGTEAHDGSDNDTEPALPSEQDIIASLKVADRHVNATEDFANDLLEGQENVPGYGKIAGRDWTFIIRKVEVNIGRPEAHERLGDVNGNAATPVPPSSKTIVDIDLGPDRQVSRSHAIISYDADTARWFVVVNGRNGLRVDNNLLKRGMKTYLRNGCVIEIAGTQMAFITTATAEGDGPIWDASIIRQAQRSSGEDDDGEDDTRTNGNRSHAHPPRRGQLQANRIPDYNGENQQQQQQQQRTHPHSQRTAPASFESTPNVLPPNTPVRSTAASAHQFVKSSPNANYARGITLESTESIDYSANNAKDLKPPHSYAQLIGMAILSTSEQQMTLNNIYKWIMANYAFYRFNTGGWQNSIRHNLSLNKAFTKIARRTDEPGKGMKWMIEPSEFETFISQGMKGCRRPPPLQTQTQTQSAFPSTQNTVTTEPESPFNGLRTSSGSVKRPPTADGQTSPPLPPYAPTYPTATEAWTPDRGPRRGPQFHNPDEKSSVGLGINHQDKDGDVSEAHNAADALDYLRSTPRNGLSAGGLHNAGSPPALYVNDEGRVGPMDTPFPLRPTQRLAPPSTLRRPSDFIQFSSPAPFWKMDGLIGSTPFRGYDMSPLKTPFPSLKPKKEEIDDTKLDEIDEKERRSSLSDASANAASIASDSISAERKRETTSAGSATSATTEAQLHRMRRPQSPIIPSSSPPRPTSAGFAHVGLDASPSTTRPASRLASAAPFASSAPAGQNPPNSGSSAKGLNLLAAATREAERHSASPVDHQSSAVVTAEQAQQHRRTPSLAPAAVINGPSSASSSTYSSASHQVQMNGWNHNEAGYPHPHHEQVLGAGNPMQQQQQQQQQNMQQHMQHAPPASMPGGGDDGDDEGIDLVKGFQPIGAFHQRNHTHLSMGLQMGAVPVTGRGSFGR